MNETTLYSITMDPPWGIIALMAGVVVTVIIAMVLKKGERTKKIVTMIILAVVMGLVGWFTLKPATLTVTTGGISSTAYGGFRVDFNELTRLQLVEPLTGSEYEPRMKINGIAVGSEKSGVFSLAGGGRAQLFLRQEDAALLAETSRGDVYLIAPEDIHPFLDAVRQASPLPVTR